VTSYASRAPTKSEPATTPSLMASVPKEKRAYSACSSLFQARKPAEHARAAGDDVRTNAAEFVPVRSPVLPIQGRRFHERGLEYRRTIKTPILLASEVGASYHATIRHYAEYHPDALALTIGGPVPPGQRLRPDLNLIGEPPSGTPTARASLPRRVLRKC
jgi:hypothetical protein